MNDDDNTPDGHGDDFWGNTPDWTDSVERPRRDRRGDRPNDITGAIKNLWGSAMTGGASVTRSHGVFDANAPRPVDVPGSAAAHVAPDPTMFDDLDSDFDFDRDLDPGATTEVPVIDARLRRLPAAVASDAPGGSGRRLDPLLARIGAVAVVTTLLVPLAIGLRSGDSDDTVASAGVPASAAPVAEVTTSDAAVESTEPAPVGSVALDPSNLPPAIPAKPDARSETSASTGADDSTNDDVAAADDGGSPTSASTGTDAAADSIEAKAGDSTSDDETTEVTVAGASSDPVCAVGYIVQSGDYWIGIAERADVPLADVLDANSADAATPLYPGADICLPAGSTTPATTAPPATTTPTNTQPASTQPPTTVAGTAPSTDATVTDTPTTDAPTTTTAAPTPSPVGRGDVEQIIRDVWPDELEDKALEIAQRESRLVPTAKNYCCYGLFQIYWEVHDSWLGGIGVTGADQLYDPATNARAAYALYQRAGGWGPWSQTSY